MNVALAALALAVGAGAVVAISVRDLRAGLIGLTVALVGATCMVDPLPGPATLGVRIVGALLVVAILRATLADESTGAVTGASFGWPAETLLAGAAALGGIGIGVAVGQSGQTGGLTGISSALLITATAAALLALGAAPALLDGSGTRRAIGLVMVAQAAILLRAGLAGAPGDLEQLVVVGLLLGCASAGAALAHDDAAGPDHADEPA
ncbi:MAG: hypothetical protein ACHQ3P_09555 [Candidatus Limnocylindrales bacterium]